MLNKFYMSDHIKSIADRFSGLILPNSANLAYCNVCKHKDAYCKKSCLLKEEKMKLKMLCDVDKGLPISDSYGNQRVCGILVDDGNFIVLFVDRVTSSLYIERVINKFAANMFCSSNFEKITDEEFNTYYKFF